MNQLRVLDGAGVPELDGADPRQLRGAGDGALSSVGIRLVPGFTNEDIPDDRDLVGGDGQAVGGQVLSVSRS